MAPESEKDFDFDDLDFSDALPEDGNGDYPKSEISLEARFKAASSEIKRRKKFGSKDDVEDFLDQYDDIAGISIAKVGGNLLHAIIEMVKHTEGIESSDVEYLVRSMVERWPDLLTNVDKDEHNPIFMAIRNGQHELVGYMISSCKDKSCLNIALSQKAQAGTTCLHVAIRDGINPETIRMLVESASDDILAVQDDIGRTPMHYAVSFKQCVEARVRLIALFIDRDMKALRDSVRSTRTFLDRRLKNGRSVYREHENTRAIYVKKYQDHLARQSQNTGISNPAPPGARAVARSKDKVRDMRQGGFVDPNGYRVGEKYSSNKDPEKELDEREKLRLRKKAEEAKKKADETKNLTVEITRRAEEIEVSLRSVRVGEREVPGREAGQARRPTSKVLEDKLNIAALETQSRNVDQQQHSAPPTPIRRRSTTQLDNMPDLEREKEKEKAKEKMPPPPAPRGGAAASGKKWMTERLGNSDIILQMLKQHYMRTRSAEMAISYLYGNNMDDVQISFDYDRLPRKMLWNDFTKRFGANAKSGLKFDRVLQYVTLPRVEVILKGVRADQERELEIQSGIRQFGPLGRKDMQYFFEWLYAKGVRHIIRVCVEDLGDSGEKVHSDQAIQKCLEKFVIERLDWSKTDLDPETILHVSSRVEKETSTPENQGGTEAAPDRQLKELHLRWSGSNAVLRAWSEPEGLAMLPHLKKIILVMPPAEKTYDNKPWMHTKIDEFRARLDASRQAVRTRALAQLSEKSSILSDFDDNDSFAPVVVEAVDSTMDVGHEATSGTSSHLNTSAPVKGVNSHRWLDSTARFAGKMAPFWNSTVTDFLNSKHHQNTPDGLEGNVVLALIDDGVDMFDTPQTNQILEGKSFDFHDEKVRPSFSSANGHGTVMASMILRVCPMVKVYPIRLKTYENAEGKNMQIDAGYAAKAIQAALDKKATIISMSWTVPMTDGDSEAKRQLHSVIQKAVDRGVLMFCSSPDEGKFTELDYPSGPWRDRFFRIGAAGADGNVFQWTPEDGITFIFPGVDVVRELAASSSFEARSMRGIPNRMVDFHETGSSVATALAAGLAAMVIYCVKASVLAVKTANQGNLHLPGTFPDNAAELIAHPDEMKRAFAGLGKVTANNFIQVWDELDKISEQLDTWRASSSNPEVQRKCVNAFVEFGQKLWSVSKHEH